MANNVTNRLKINSDKETVLKIMDFLKGKGNDNNMTCYIDFNNIVPIPKELMIESSSSGKHGLKYIMAMQQKNYNSPEDLKIIQWMESLSEKEKKESIQLGKLYLRNKTQYGYPTWYEWTKATWGTKWNAYNQDFEEPDVLWFDTAWNGVPLLIEKLSEIFPTVEFDYAYADEYLGSNTGKGIAKGGEIQMILPNDGSNEAFEIMFEVKPGADKYFELTNEGYKWKT